MAASNVIEILIKAKDAASDVVGSVVDTVSSSFENMSRTLISAGTGLALLTAPMVAGLYDATNQAVMFDEAMTNVQAIIKSTDAETAALGDTILDLGANSRYGPQALAESYYDIVGGVADASAHMDILQASVRTAQAGNAELTATTSALISVMNSYQFAADDASRVSDNLVQIVNKGVGTMDEFAAALPTVSGLASSAGISLEDLGGQMAFLTTQGFSASQSATFLRSMITTLQNPTADLANIIEDLGYTSGSALIEAEGLAGAYDLIKDAAGGSFDGVITNQEALLGAISLTNDAADEFLTNYTDGMEGIAAATEAIQMDSPAAQMDLFKSSISALKIEIGEALIPAMNDMLDTVQPVISAAIDWARKNPKLISTIAGVVAGVAALAAGLTTVGGVIGAVIPALGLIFSPLGLIAAAAAGLYIAFQKNFLGIRDFVYDVADSIGDFVGQIQGLVEAGASVGDILQTMLPQLGFSDAQTAGIITNLTLMYDWLAVQIPAAIKILGQFWEDTLLPALQTTGEFIVSTVLPAFLSLAATLASNIPAAITAAITLWEGTLYPALQVVWGFISGSVLPVLSDVVGWLATHIPGAISTASTFWNTTLKPALEDVWAFITTSVIPAFSNIGTWLQINIPAAVTAAQSAWETILKPALETVAGFITGTAIPAFQNIYDFLQVFIPAAITTVQSAWETTLKPALETVALFITGTAIPAFQNVYDFLQVFIPGAITTVQSAWETTLKPALETVAGFITGTAIPAFQNVYDFLQVFIPGAITKAVTDVSTALTPAFDILAGFITTTVIPGFQQIWDFLQLHLPGAVLTIKTAWETILQPALEIAANFITSTVLIALQGIYDFFQLFIPGAIGVGTAAWDTVLMPALEAGATFLATSFVGTLQSIYDFLSSFIPGAIDVAAAAWTNVIYPAITTVGDFISDTLIPAFQSVYDFAQTYIPDALDIIANAFSTVAGPAASGFETTINLVDGALRAIRDIIREVSSGLNELGESFGGIADTIPDWLIPGSPTPFELGLWGIESALDALNRRSLPRFGDELNTGSPIAASNSSGSGDSIYYIDVQVDAATVNDVENTRENAERFAREIERALGAVG